MQLTGIHHLTAVTSQAKENREFYTNTLGLRLVKKTVNQDDVSAYHLFYADGAASPGSDITFFDWPATPEKRGTNSIVRTAFRIGKESFSYWSDRFAIADVKSNDITERDGRKTLEFTDPECQRLALIEDNDKSPIHPWSKSAVETQHQIRGLGPITISVPDLKATADVLTGVMNMRAVREYESSLSDGSNGVATTHVFEMGEGGPAAELHVSVEPNIRAARLGAGGVHHVAFRVPTFGEYDQWGERLKSMRIGSSGPVDRFYFKSLYFREPNGILFELATDGPGFAADESLETLGERLSLPPFLEHRRSEIEARLKPL